MLLIRTFEEKVSSLYRDSLIPGFVHVSIGQEATAVGVCAALGPDDYLTSTHRGHGHCLARGMHPDRMIAELFGKVDGYCRGKGGSMHIADPSLGMLGANGIVGGGLPIAVGAAVGCKLRQRGVAAAFFGEGAVSTGAFHESINLAAAWDLPILFVCENNRYVEFSPWESLSRQRSVAERAPGYGIEAAWADGNDVEEVYAAASAQVARLREGTGPFLLELQTYRYHGHYEGDPEVYRTADETSRAREYDPVDLVRKRLLERRLMSQETLHVLEEQVNNEVDAAVKFAEASPYPDPEEVDLHV
jgi:TPP-dependent pyruvate/acetoin dehydrogenase alpha subunit